MIGWILDPGLVPQDRAQRSAELLLWSQVTTGRHDAGWHDVATEAGFDVRSQRKRPDTHYVWSDEGSETLKLSRIIATVHGPAGADLYRVWNTATHPDPIALVARATVRIREGGIRVGGLHREDHDVEVAVHIADVVAASIECQAGYFGRSAVPADGCRAIAAELREFLPIVAAEVSRRNAGTEK